MPAPDKRAGKISAIYFNDILSPSFFFPNKKALLGLT